jgi:hypothetical protein
MSPERRAEIETMVEAATPGPWRTADEFVDQLRKRHGDTT